MISKIIFNFCGPVAYFRRFLKVFSMQFHLRLPSPTIGTSHPRSHEISIGEVNNILIIIIPHP
jgi:hypothetical protein